VDQVVRHQEGTLKVGLFLVQREQPVLHPIQAALEHEGEGEHQDGHGGDTQE